jgi:hypothetical protein
LQQNARPKNARQRNARPKNARTRRMLSSDSKRSIRRKPRKKHSRIHFKQRLQQNARPKNARLRRMLSSDSKRLLAVRMLQCGKSKLPMLMRRKRRRERRRKRKKTMGLTLHVTMDLKLTWSLRRCTMKRVAEREMKGVAK